MFDRISHIGSTGGLHDKGLIVAELDIHPESGVDMVVNGKRIARGELLRIGDVLGIRIMELS